MTGQAVVRAGLQRRAQEAAHEDDLALTREDALRPADLQAIGEAGKRGLRDATNHCRGDRHGRMLLSWWAAHAPMSLFDVGGVRRFCIARRGPHVAFFISVNPGPPDAGRAGKLRNDLSGRDDRVTSTRVRIASEPGCVTQTLTLTAAEASQQIPVVPLSARGVTIVDLSGDSGDYQGTVSPP